MCTNFALIKKNGTTTLADSLGIDPNSLIFNENIKPASTISIVMEHEGERQIVPAIWWLYLQQTDTGLIPHKDYFSVNSNHAKLPSRPEYKRSRCIIPATSFVESQDGKHPHLLEPSDGSAIAFGGLFKTWVDKVTGEVIHSASIITLKGHKSLENIHRKSTPLWLPQDSYEDWLNREITDTEQFDELLIPTLRTGLTATPIDKTMSKNPIAPSFEIVNE
jgi:putative SOS response-associated peptidase YedK